MAPQTRNQGQQRQQAAQQHGPQQHAPPQNGNGARTPEQAAADAKLLDEIIEYKPLGEAATIKLSVNIVRNRLCTPTKSGHYPPNAEVVKFIMICRQRGLNPWVGDAYLLGYETRNQGDKWSIVVAIQALLKRAEINAQFDGIESGVVVISNDEIVERAGDLVYDGEELVGGWAKVYRKDRGRPFYQRLRLSTYARQTHIWDTDPAGMICKDAEAAALRQAFPSDVGSLYLESELMGMLEDNTLAPSASPPKPTSAKNEIASRLGGYKEPTSDTVVGKAPEKTEGSQVRQEAHGEHDQRADDQGSGDGNGSQEGPGDGEEASQGAEDAGEHEVKFG